MVLFVKLCMLSSRHRFYAPLVFACVLHGVAFSAAFWYGLTHAVGTWVEPSCKLLLFTWPALGLILCWSSKRWSRTVFRLMLGFLAIAPTLLVPLGFVRRHNKSLMVKRRCQMPLPAARLAQVNRRLNHLSQRTRDFRSVCISRLWRGAAAAERSP